MDQPSLMQIVEDTLEVPAGTVSPEQKLSELDWDSLANLSFIAAVDSHFNVPLDAEGLARCETVQDLLALVADAQTVM
ncbi:acyl carrier protein [Cryobacterium sp. TmT2-59]|uniref:Acyl carrier protein n=1 Tax=Cryobacterium shii TaxID=1259235 RepID=A0AAQ2C5C7_9MICO|nr:MULTISPECIES: acyl carrier protein [Cryobacterium]TFC44948.1 acyl carrier protein [Cryobacterium shii]TFC89627.1 acyl carrier protein [Cryobacterium sp. TmT2-59]TFD11987.1 acyl carrier protein [Cryobacterium sp. TMT4-10]